MSYAVSKINAEALAPLSYTQRVQLADRKSYITQIESLADKGLVVAIRTVAESVGVSYGTLRRWYYESKRTHEIALVDKRKTVKLPTENIFYREYCRYCAMDKNTDQGGYDSLMRDLRKGYCFSFGTWRDCFKRDFPDRPVPSFCPINYTPRGFTYARMNQLKKDDGTRAMALAWARQGQFAALKNTLPVLRSRIGLKPGQVVQSDDVWHNTDVYAPGQNGVFNPLEFAFYDIASGFKVVSAMKPRLLLVDPATGKEKRDNLKEQQYRFAVAHLMCDVGFHKDGIRLIGERGTTRLREEVLRKIAAVPGYGERFHFEMSGVKNTPAHTGMFMGNAGGNPRMKSLCECAHNILHNATASILGNHGRDAAHLHESNAALVRYSKDLIEQAQRIDPRVLSQLMLPILDYKTYQQYFYAIEDEVMDRTNIRMEGWTENETTEYRLSEESPWLPISGLADMSPAENAAVMAVVAQNPQNLMRKRKMSRREVWVRGRCELDRWPTMEAPAFLDPRDARETTVRPSGTIEFTDAQYFPGEIKRYVAQYQDRKTGVSKRIAPGQKVRFYWIPVGDLANQIWLTNDEDDVLGMCPLLKTASWNDPHSIKVAMGQQQAQIAELMAETHQGGAMSGVARKAADTVNRALLDAAASEANAPIIMGEEPPVEIEDPTDFLDQMNRIPHAEEND